MQRGTVETPTNTSTLAQDWTQNWMRSVQNMLAETMVFPFTLEELFTNDKAKAHPLLPPQEAMKTCADLSAQLYQNPTVLSNAYTHFLQESSKLSDYFVSRLLGEKPSPFYAPDCKDRRFRDKTWEDNPYFDTLKQAYFMLCETILQMNTALSSGDSLQDRKRHFWLRQFLDACSPTNFALSNPVVLRTFFESGGLNFIQGTERFLNDLNRSKGNIALATNDASSFKVGKNLAATPGKIIFQNEIMQLIQYAPTTRTVQKNPLLIIPPWINKYYILDLKPENSFVKWVISTGVTVFIVSWVKAKPVHAQKSFEHYMREGIFDALDAMYQATKATAANVIGYCLGGTLLLSALAYCLHPRCSQKPKMRIKSATLLTTLADFKEAGDLSIFTDDNVLERLEMRMNQEGFLNGNILFDTFNILRANDLIWSYFVDCYLLGKTPPPHDILFWNADLTNIPRALHSFVLRNFYKKNLLAQPNALKIGGLPIDLQRINVPIFMLSTQNDHIAPWRATYAATQFLKKADLTFVLAGSGHVAGIVNPPAAKKYGYWTYPKFPVCADDWLAHAQETAGSWWLMWRQWLDKYAGGCVPSRVPTAENSSAFEEAPGTYVLDRSA
ncbi:MAG: class I poly(R)-hydroxyalkanoic acid synthase [Holosporales bacterium]|jgi:polyhydroxyalkanoate synthase|nr:class I poly(R)-hydroxyalkanoic acid synthase [Holosporales bacterium]